MASAPVSPMKMRAGAAFHQRNPVHAPAIAAATSARSSAGPDAVDLGVAELPEADEHERGEREGGRTPRPGRRDRR